HTIAQMNTSNSFENPLITHNYANTADNNAVTIGVSMIPAKAFTEDWHLAEGYLSDRPANAINANNTNSIAFGDIQITQKGEPIGEFYSKLLKYRKILNLDEQQIKGQFLRGLSSDLEDNEKYISTEQLLADLFEILEQIEMQKAEKKLGL
ncbi:7190_t:CDS:2, partial [Scutellospora calospora]